MRSGKISVVALVVTVLLASAAAADSPNSGHKLTADLTGGAERPGPGDPDGSGSATVNPQPSKNRVCYTLKVEDIDAATAAHIHLGGSDVAGPVVVPLAAPSSGRSSGCVENLGEELVRNIKKNPEDYYVNVHNRAFPRGAVRGQLEH